MPNGVQEKSPQQIFKEKYYNTLKKSAAASLLGERTAPEIAKPKKSDVKNGISAFKDVARGFFASLNGTQGEREAAIAISEGKVDELSDVMSRYFKADINPVKIIDKATGEVVDSIKYPDFYRILQNAYHMFVEQYESMLPEGTPKTFEELLMLATRDKVSELLRPTSVFPEAQTVAPSQSEEKKKTEAPKSEEEGTKEKKDKLTVYPRITKKKEGGEIILPERPKTKDVDLSVNVITTKEMAEAMLNSPGFYKESARRRAQIKEAAGVELGQSRLERELEATVRYRPYGGYYFSELIDEYEKAQEHIGNKVREKIIKSANGQQVAVVDFHKEDPEREAEWYIAASMQTLLSMISRRHFEDEERAHLREIINGFDYIINVDNSEAGRQKAAKYEKIHEAIEAYAEGAMTLIEYWEKYLTGDEALMTTTHGAAKGATARMNEIMFLWWHDPKIVEAYHLSSARSKDDLMSCTKLSFWGNKKGEIVYETEMTQGENGEQRISRKRKDRKQTAYEVIGEILNVASLKVRMDPAQASEIAYSVYREDQFGMQHSDQKYNAREFQRMLRVNRAGRIELINNNEMATLFTWENSQGLISKWLDLIEQSADFENTGIFIGRKNLAALISWAGEIDPRKPGNNPGEALDLDAWLELSPEKQDEVLSLHLKRFLDDSNFLKNGKPDSAYAREQRNKIIQRNLARGRTRMSDKKLKEPIYVKSRYTGETKVLEYVPILEPVIDLDEHWFNPLTKKWEFCINTRWFFQEKPGSPLAINNEEVVKDAAERGLGEVADPETIKNLFLADPRKHKDLFFAREGQITGQTPVNVSSLFIYEGYKQSDAKLLATMIKAGSVNLYQEHQKLLQQLSSEDRGKQSYTIPEYWVSVINHLINETVRSEILPQLYFARYAGRHMEFLGQLEQFKRVIDFEIDEKLDFETTNTDGSYGELMSSVRVPPERRLRQLLMRNAYRPVWEHFAEKNDLSLEEMLAFAGLQEKTPGKTRLDAKGQETGYMELEIIEEASGKWKTPGEWKSHDNWKEEGSASSRKIAELRQKRAGKGKDLMEIYRDFERSGTFKFTVFNSWDLWTLTRKIVLGYVDDMFEKNEKVTGEILEHDRIVREIVRDREFKKKEYGELYGDKNRDPASLRWVTFNDGQEHTMHDLWKRRQIYNKILREHQIPMGDEMVNGKYMFTQWEDLEFLPSGEPNPNYHSPKVKLAKVDREKQEIVGDFKYLNEIMDPDDKRLAMAYDDYAEREKEVLEKHKSELEEIEKMPRNTPEENDLFLKRYTILQQTIQKEAGENVLASSKFSLYQHAFQSGQGGALCTGLDLSAGWWEFQPETGLTERWPDWIEPEFVIGMTAFWSAPYRMAVAERLTDVSFKHKHPEIKFVTPEIRKGHEWKELYEPIVEEQMMVAMGPDHYTNLVHLLQGQYIEGFMDNEPARETLARQLGVLDEQTAKRYLKYLHDKNFMDGKIDNPFEHPHAIEELEARVKSERKRLINGIQKFAFFKALPESAEGLALLLGNEPSEMIESGKTDKDVIPKWAAGVGVPVVITIGGLVALNATIVPVTALWQPWAIFVAAEIVGNAMGAAGWILYKDRSSHSLVPVKWLRTEVLDAEDVRLFHTGNIKGFNNRWIHEKNFGQKVKSALPTLAANIDYVLFYKIGNLKPLQRQRLEEVMMGRAHTAIIDPKKVIIETGQKWKESFNKNPVTGGR